MTCSKSCDNSEGRAVEVIGAGQFPGSKPWKENADGPRTVEQAIALARQHGVSVADDVTVVVDEWDLIAEPLVDARYFRWRGLPTDTIHWQQFYAANGKIPVLLKPLVLASDEAIVAVLAHEMFELESLRGLFAASGGRMLAARLRDLIDTGMPRNLHDQAWEIADQAVERMRRMS